jgi:hypothetical protein
MVLSWMFDIVPDRPDRLRHSDGGPAAFSLRHSRAAWRWWNGCGLQSP